MKSMSKTKFRHYLLSNTFSNKLWISPLDILSLSTQHSNKGHHEKKIQFKQHFAITFKHLTPQKRLVLVYRSTFPYTWPCLLPRSKCNWTGPRSHHPTVFYNRSLNQDYISYRYSPQFHIHRGVISSLTPTLHPGGDQLWLVTSLSMGWLTAPASCHPLSSQWLSSAYLRSENDKLRITTWLGHDTVTQNRFILRSMD